MGEGEFPPMLWNYSVWAQDARLAEEGAARPLQVERERERPTNKERERERERAGGGVEYGLSQEVV